MTIPELLETIASRAASGATVKNVYGEPVTVGDRTVIPVAEVRYGFGGGGGAKENGEHGGGGGGRCVARPVGALEITAQATRFVPLDNSRRLGFAFALGFLAGAAILALAGPHRIEIVKRAT